MIPWPDNGIATEKKDMSLITLGFTVCAKGVGTTLAGPVLVGPF